MVPVARRNLLADKVKLLVALSGVTLAIVLILVVQSLYEGVRREAATFVYSLPGDVWITQRGTTDLVFSNSHLQERAVEGLRAVPGVDRVYGLSGRLMSFQVDGGEVRTYVMALDPLGDPIQPESQALIPQLGTIIIDRTFARQTGLSRGEQLEFGDHAFTIAEIRDVGNVLVTQFAFVSPQDFRQVFGIPGTVNYFLVSVAEGVSPAATVGPLSRQIEGSSVFTTDQFASRSSKKGTGDFLPIIRVIVVISFIVGLAVLSLTIYAATIERAREYAIMKVLGASPLNLYRIVLSQSILIAVVGFGVGVGLAFLFNRLASGVVPQFITYIRWQDVLAVLAAALVMAVLAAFIPVRRVAGIDPAAVFRA